MCLVHVRGQCKSLDYVFIFMLFSRLQFSLFFCLSHITQISYVFVVSNLNCYSYAQYDVKVTAEILAMVKVK